MNQDLGRVTEKLQYLVYEPIVLVGAVKEVGMVLVECSPTRKTDSVNRYPICNMSRSQLARDAAGFG